MMALQRFGPSWYHKPTPAPRQAFGAFGRKTTPGYTPPPGQAGPVTPGYTPPAAATGAGGDVAPPVDPIYPRQVAQNLANYQTTVSGITGERTRQLQQYGYKGQFDEAGNLIGNTLEFDPTDPYSRAALMKDRYDAQQAATGLQRAARGGLYAGSYQTAQDAVTRGRLMGEDTLQKSLREYLSGTTGRIAQAGIDRGQGDINAATDAYTRSLNAPY